jgi:hypothetical protein
MQDYYKNLTLEDINNIENIDLVFKYWKSYYNSNTKDLYFFGIKSDKDLDKDYINYLESFIYENNLDIIKCQKK